jgi:hypothetical protein
VQIPSVEIFSLSAHVGVTQEYLSEDTAVKSAQAVQTPVVEIYSLLEQEV